MAPKDYDPELSDSVSLDTTRASIFRTGTGLDRIVDAILEDPGLNLRLSEEEIIQGAQAAAQMNRYIKHAIRQTGVANDGDITAADIYAISDFIRANHYQGFKAAHGNDENGTETGFHLVQNDGGTLHWFGDRVVDQVADGLYHLVFGYENGRIINEDGDANASMEDLATWLSEILADDLAAGTLAKASVNPEPSGTTGTGLDVLVDTIMNDPGLTNRVSVTELAQAADAANTMNEIIIDAIKALGIANDGSLSPSDVAGLADYIKDNHYAAWVAAHGDDENNSETGFHLAQNDGGQVRMFGDAGVDQVADGIYHLGFGHRNGRLINEDGDGNAELSDVAHWLNELLAEELADGTLVNPNASALPSGTTGTGLDHLVDLINDDPGLAQRVSLNDRREGAEAADVMNSVIVDSIRALGLADDGNLEPSEVYDLANYIQANHYDVWVEAHGDDENGVETGFHLVQNDGDEGNTFGRSTVDTIADAIYHLGFGYSGDRLINEDGNANERVEEVTHWLNELLADDLASGGLASGNADRATGTTGTGLDKLVTIISAEAELNRRLPKEEVEEGAAAADAMNRIIVDGIVATGIANDGKITAADVRDLSDWIAANHHDAWIEAHGDDENDSETAFHLVQNDGAVARLYSHNAVNTVADAIYHLGFGYDSSRLINEDGDRNQPLTDVAYWLEALLSDDLASGDLRNDAVDLYPTGSTGSGLDQMVQAVTKDGRLTQTYKASELAEIAANVDGLNAILIEAIEATGVLNDGAIDPVDVAVLDGWISRNKAGEWAALRGDDDADTGIMGLVWKGAVTQVAGDNAVNEVGRALYSLGHGTKWSGVQDEDGDYVGALDDVAVWLNQILYAEIADGALVNDALSPRDPAGFAGDIVAALDVPVSVNDEDGTEEFPASGLNLDAGTVTFTFVSEYPEQGTQALLGKDRRDENDGDMTVYINNGQMYVRLTDGGSHSYVSVPLDIEAGQAYDFALSFGDKGLSVWINGEQVVYSSAHTDSWAENDNALVVGGSNWRRDSDKPDNVSNEFQGEILNFAVYDRQLDRGEISGLSRGVTADGGAGNDNIVGTDAQDALYGGLDHDVIVAGAGDDAVYGGYGSDNLDGGDGDDVLDGGHGNDIVNGGDGNDIIIATADAREPKVAQLFDGPNGIPEDESGFAHGGATGPCPNTGGPICYCGTRREGEPNTPDPDNELDYETAKLYPDQPLPAEDILTGGRGADTFRFQTLINAKEEIILKHVRDDGTINWAGVAGENDELHDHWVEAIGDDVITDFSRAEGDKIEIAGHTTRIASITFEDSDGDGVDDHSVIYLISDQGGNGGAHDQDYLGSITVYGDLLQEGDITVDAAPTYGIVETVYELDEAIAPLQVSDADPRDIPANLTADGAPLRDGDGSAGMPQPVAAAAAGMPPQGDGLTGRVWNTGDPLPSLTAFESLVASRGPTHQITVTELEFGGGADNQSLRSFLGENGAVTSGNGNAVVETMGMTLSGYIYIPAGFHTISVASDDGFSLKIGGVDLIEFAGLRGGQNTSAFQNFGDGGLFEIELTYFENEDEQMLRLELDGEVVDSSQLYTSLEVFENATVAQPNTIPQTGTGLDQIIGWIEADQGLRDRIPDSEIEAGARAAAAMNAIIVEAIIATGAANDGVIDAGDAYDIADWINQNRYDAWLEHHGDDEDGVETAFHLVQNDGAVDQVFGDDAINTVADAIYHLGFGYSGDRLINEDGNRNERVEEVAFWLNELLAADLAAGTLENPAVVNDVEGTTGTGLDVLVDTIMDDGELSRRIPDDEQATGAEAADAMNHIIVDSIRALGLANDGTLTHAEVRLLAEYIQANHYDAWVLAHGDDENNSETGFHLVQNDGSTSRLYGRNAVDTVADGLYHLGFGHNGSRVINEDGASNATIDDVTYWLNDLLADDLADLANPDVSPTAPGTTGTGLDHLVELINTDHGLNDRLSLSEINDGAAAADQMNAIIVDSIRALGIANDGKLDVSEIYLLADHIKANHYAAWVEAHGDDERNSETGFHLVQGDGDLSLLFGERGIDKVADGLYHLGFGYSNGRLINEDGDSNVSVEDATYWLNELLKSDLENDALSNPDAPGLPVGTTGTGLDQLVSLITSDPGLNLKISAADIAAGAAAADAMNHIIVASVVATGIANNGRITASDIRVLAEYIEANHYDAWLVAHGDDENNSETGFHLVQNDGGQTRLFDEAAVDTIADGLYHLGFGHNRGRLINEDGDANASLSDAAYWLEELLRGDLDAGTLANPNVDLYPQGTTGTGLDALVEMISTDEGLLSSLSTADIATAARAADEIGHILVEGIMETGIANDGQISAEDLKDLDRWVAENYASDLRALHGDEPDSGATGFHIVDTWHSTSPLFGEDGVNTVADSIYSIGFGVAHGTAIRSQSGGWQAYLSDVAGWMNQLLTEELENGSFYNADMAYSDPAVFASDIVAAISAPVVANGDDGFVEIAHTGAQALAEGTVAMTVTLDSLPEEGESMTLFTKDARDFGDGGHTSIYVYDGKLYVRVQDEDSNNYLSAGDDLPMETGRAYKIALTFDGDQVSLYVDGERMDSRTGLDIDWISNAETIVVGGSGAYRTGSNPDQVYSVIDGTISEFAVYDRVLNRGELAGLNGENRDVPAGSGSEPAERQEDGIQIGSLDIEQGGRSAWVYVAFDQPIEDAVVITAPLSYNGAQASIARVRNVTDEGFEVQVEEWAYLNGIHTTETVTWMAASAGDYTLADGRSITFGSTVADHQSQTVGLTGFDDETLVLTQVSSHNDTTPTVARVSSVDQNGFTFRLAEEQAGDGIHGAETVHWVAIEEGEGGDLTALSLDRGVTHRWTDTGIDVDDHLFAGSLSAYGRDTGYIRQTSLNDDTISVRFQEERSKDPETRHRPEDLALLHTDNDWVDLYSA